MATYSAGCRSADDVFSNAEYETSSSTSESEVERGPIGSSTPKTAPPVAKKVSRPLFRSENRAESNRPGIRQSQELPVPYDRDDLPSKKRARHTPTGRPKSNEITRRLPSSGATDDSSAVLSALGELTSTLNKVVKRLEKTEHRIQSMEEKMDSSISSSASDSRRKTGRKVPVIVRSETRKVYQTLIDEDSENFTGFSIGPDVTFKDPANQAVSCRLVKEVHGLNPTFDAADIRIAVYTYYKTLCQEQSLQRRGVSSQRKKQRRRRERIAQKLQERQAVFKKLSYDERDREKWKKVLQVNFMSSEESDDGEVIEVRPLPWRSDRVTTFLHSLDDKARDNKSPQARRQMKTRREGAASSRVQPTHGIKGQALNPWMFTMCNN